MGKQSISVIIDHRGSIICPKVNGRIKICYKWRSQLAWKECKDCPMQKLIIKTPMNAARFGMNDQ